jgi:hypothetical protein
MFLTGQPNRRRSWPVEILTTLGRNDRNLRETDAKGTKQAKTFLCKKNRGSALSARLSTVYTKPLFFRAGNGGVSPAFSIYREMG